MSVTQYIGSRYVPLFADPIEWSASNTYEPLTIVLHEGNSYTSKQAVPKDIDISNEAFWALTGNYDAQVELYRRETAAAREAAGAAQDAADAAQDAADAAQTDIDTLLPKSAFSESSTVAEGINKVGTVSKNFVTKARLDGYATVRYETSHRLQGGTYFSGRIALACDNANNELPAHVYLIDANTGQILANNTDNQFGHANDITYNDKEDCLVIAGCDRGDGQPYKVYKLNPYNLNIIETLTPSVNFWGIAYVTDEDRYYAIANNKGYVLDASLNVLESFDIANSFMTNQGIAADSEYVYSISSTNNIVNVYTHDFENVAQIPLLLNRSIEPEWLAFDGQRVFVGCNGLNEPYAVVYKTSFEPNTFASSYFTNIDGDYVFPPETNVYVSYGLDVTIGDGTQNNPLGCISAFEGISYQASNLKLHITGDCPTALVALHGVSTFTVEGASATFASGNFAGVPALFVTGCTFNGAVNAYNTNAHFTSCNFNAASGFALTINGGSGVCSSCTFNGTGRGVNVISALYAETNCTHSNTGAGDNAYYGQIQSMRPIIEGNDDRTKVSFKDSAIGLYNAFVIELRSVSDNARCLIPVFRVGAGNNSLFGSGFMSPGNENFRSFVFQGAVGTNNTINVNFAKWVYMKDSAPTLNDAYVYSIYGLN